MNPTILPPAMSKHRKADKMSLANMASQNGLYKPLRVIKNTGN